MRAVLPLRSLSLKPRLACVSPIVARLSSDHRARRLYTAEDEKVVEKEFCHEGWDAGYKLEYAVRSHSAVLLL